mgnify:CR=1 FL=1
MREAGASGRKLVREASDGVGWLGGVGLRGGGEKVMKSELQARVEETTPLKSSESGEGGREREETGDPGVVLDPRGDKAKKAKVLGDPKRSGSSLNPNLTGHPSGGEEGSLEAG